MFAELMTSSSRSSVVNKINDVTRVTPEVAAAATTAIGGQMIMILPKGSLFAESHPD
jgi:hypothetical protein